MADDERERLRKVAVDHVQVARTDTARGHAHEHLALLRRRQLDVEDLDRPARLSEDGCLCPHGGERTAPGP